jgi:signal recognition particle GTPase
LFGDSDLDIEANQIPLARILYGEPSKYFDYEKFKENEQEFKSLYKEIKEAPKRGDAARYKGISEGANKTLNEVRKMLKQLRAAEQEARKISDYTERMIRVQQIRDKQRKLVMRWNKYYEQARD